MAQKAEKACECIAHILQALIDRDANATVVTVDGVGGVRSDLQKCNQTSFAGPREVVCFPR